MYPSLELNLHDTLLKILLISYYETDTSFCLLRPLDESGSWTLFINIILKILPPFSFCLSVCARESKCPWKLGVLNFPGVRVTGVGARNLLPLREQDVLLLSTEPSLQPWIWASVCSFS